jgi:hypothetical protein
VIRDRILFNNPKPLPQLLSMILRLLWYSPSRPKRHHTNPHQNTYYQHDDDLSSAHSFTLSKPAQLRNLFALNSFGNDLQSRLFKPGYRADLSMVKKPVIIWTLVAAAALIGVLVVVLVPGRERVTLTFLNYQRTPYGAMLKLSNDTRRTITYVNIEGGLPSLSQRKTPNGWTNTSIPIREFNVSMRGNSQPNEPKIFACVFSDAGGSQVKLVRSRELAPGQSAEVYVGLEPNGLPIRVGVVCYVPQGPVAQRIGTWVGWLKQQCHLKSTPPPGQIEVWCPEPLQVSAKPTRASNE